MSERIEFYTTYLVEQQGMIGVFEKRHLGAAVGLFLFCLFLWFGNYLHPFTGIPFLALQPLSCGLAIFGHAGNWTVAVKRPTWLPSLARRCPKG